MILTMIDGMWCYYEHFNYKKILYLWNSIKGFQGFTKVEMMVIDLSELEIVHLHAIRLFENMLYLSYKILNYNIY